MWRVLGRWGDRMPRAGLRARLLPALLAALLPATIPAQFTEPASDELKMTSEPKATGAAAVFLYREETQDETKSTVTDYERIKVLTEKGLNQATVHLAIGVGFDKVTSIDGRTIHADGKVFPLTTKPEDLMAFKTKGLELDDIVFTLPYAEVGCILEYRIQLHYSKFLFPPQWRIQQSYFVSKARYVFNSGVADSRMAYSGRLPKDAHVVQDKKGAYILEVTDVPALPDEEDMPPLNLLTLRVDFYFTRYATIAGYWEDAALEWGMAMKEITEPTAELKKAVSQIVGPADSEQAKAEKIYAAVMQIENTDFTRAKSKAERKKNKQKEVKKLEDIWKQKSGWSDAIALLYAAMCRAANLDVWPMRVADRSRSMFDQNYPFASQLDDYIAVAKIDGKDIYLDPGEKMCPFGALHWKHTLTTGFRMSSSGTGAMARTPGAISRNSEVARSAVLKVDESGDVEGTARFAMSGSNALHWRQLSLENDPDEVKKQFDETVGKMIQQGVHANIDNLMALDDFTVNLIAIVKISGSLGAATGKRLFLPGAFFESGSSHPFATEEKRVTPVDLQYPSLVEDEVTYFLPAGFALESMPQKAQVQWPDSAELEIDSSSGEGMVKVSRSLEQKHSMIDPKDYPQLHDFYRKVATADQQQLVLTRGASAGTKGN